MLVTGGPNVTLIKSSDQKQQFLKNEIVESQPDKKERGKPLRQIIAAFVANIGTINIGLVFGFSAVAIPQLKAIGSDIKISEDDISWIGECFLSVFFLIIE